MEASSILDHYDCDTETETSSIPWSHSLCVVGYSPWIWEAITYELEITSKSWEFQKWRPFPTRIPEPLALEFWTVTSFPRSPLIHSLSDCLLPLIREHIVLWAVRSDSLRIPENECFPVNHCLSIYDSQVEREGSWMDGHYKRLSVRPSITFSLEFSTWPLQHSLDPPLISLSHERCWGESVGRRVNPLLILGYQTFYVLFRVIAKVSKRSWEWLPVLNNDRSVNHKIDRRDRKL